ncbi:MAG: M1 family aminopeptidase [Gemmatimonadota bacterium]
MTDLHRALALALLLALCPAVLAQPEAPPERLDPRVAPTFEQIELRLDPDSSGYSGVARFDLQVSARVERFSFSARGMSLDQLELGSAAGAVPLAIESVRAGVVTVLPEVELEPGRYELTVTFHNDYDTRATSLYRAVVDGESYVFTDFEPTEARSAWPCWDEPAYKIPFQITVRAPVECVVVSNTPVESEVVRGRRKTVRFEKTPPMSTYLLALAVGPLEDVPIPDLPVEGRVYTAKGKSHLAELVTQVAPPILAALEAYFGSPYPYRKLDLIAVPEFAPGAMENVGLVTFREDLLLVHGEAGGTAERREQALVLAHELAHMWFGNLVTMAWWDDLWLNESFASWIEYKVVDQVYPELRTRMELTQGEHLMRDARPSTGAIRKPVRSAADVMDDLELAYGKGQAVLEMVERWVGPAIFRRGVIEYLGRYAWGNATGADLWGALGEASGKDVASVMASFLDQPGCPLVRVTPGRGRTLVLTQERFLNYGVRARKQLWTVPVRLRYSDGRKVDSLDVVLSSASQQVQVAGLPVAARDLLWVHPDAGALGYYRWAVPAKMLVQLSQSARDRLSARERIGFLDNAAGLLDAGLLGADQYLAILERFADDPEPEVVRVVVREGMTKVWRTFGSSDLEPAYSAYVRRALGPSAVRFGLEPAFGDQPGADLLRPSLFRALGRAGDPEVQRRGEELALQYLDDPRQVDAALAGASLVVAARRGGPDLVQAYTAAIGLAPTPADRERLVTSLGAFHDPAARRAALDFCLEDGLRPPELLTVPYVMAQYDPHEGADIASEWTRAHYAELAGRMPRFQVPYLLYVIGDGCSRTRLDTARAFFEQPAYASPVTERYLEKVADSVSDCAGLREREGASAARYLQRTSP